MFLGFTILFAFLALIPLAVCHFGDFSESVEKHLTEAGVILGAIAGACGAIALAPVLFAVEPWLPLLEIAVIAIVLAYAWQQHMEKQIAEARTYQSGSHESEARIELNSESASFGPTKDALAAAASSGASVGFSFVVAHEDDGGANPVAQVLTRTTESNKESWFRQLRNSLGDGAQLYELGEAENPRLQLARQTVGLDPAAPIKLDT